MPEPNFYMTNSTVANVYNTTPQILNIAGAIAQSDGWAGRSGSTIRVKKVTLVIWAQCATTCDRSGLFTRIGLIKAAQQTYDTAPGSSNLLQTDSHWYSPHNPAYCPTKFVWLKDTMKTTPQVEQTAVNVSLPQHRQQIVQYFGGAGHEIVFDQDTDNIMKGGLYAIFTSNQSSNPPTITYDLQVEFYP